MGSLLCSFPCVVGGGVSNSCRYVCDSSIIYMVQYGTCSLITSASSLLLSNICMHHPTIQNENGLFALVSFIDLLS